MYVFICTLGTGILSSLPEENPHWWNANMVWVSHYKCYKYKEGHILGDFHNGYVGTVLDLKSLFSSLLGSSHIAQVMYGVEPQQKLIKVSLLARC